MSFPEGLLASGSGVRFAVFSPRPGLRFPGGLLASGSWAFLQVPVVPGMELSRGDYWLLGAWSNLPIPAAPGIEFPGGFTGPWERGIVYSARFRAKRCFAGGLLKNPAVSAIFARFRPKPCLAGGLLKILAFFSDPPGLAGRGTVRQRFPRAHIFFSGGRVVLAGPGSTGKVTEGAPGSARKGGKRGAPVHSGAETSSFSGNFTPHG